VTQASACAHCDAPLTSETTVHLWDGRDYCRACVEDACEGMADYAADHPRLEETLPFLLRRFIRVAFSTILLNALLASLIVYYLGPAGGGARTFCR